MLPVTYPTHRNAISDQAECVVYYLTSISGLSAWIDYIPVKTVIHTGNTEGTTDANGYQAINVIDSTSNKQAWLDYIPVYEDVSATLPFKTDSGGYIPVGISSNGLTESYAILKEDGFRLLLENGDSLLLEH